MEVSVIPQIVSSYHKFSKIQSTENLKINFSGKVGTDFEPCNSFGVYFNANDHANGTSILQGTLGKIYWKQNMYFIIKKDISRRFVKTKSVKSVNIQYFIKKHSLFQINIFPVNGGGLPKSRRQHTRLLFDRSTSVRMYIFAIERAIERLNACHLRRIFKSTD